MGDTQEIAGSRHQEVDRLRARIAELESHLAQSKPMNGRSGEPHDDRYRRLIESIGVITWECDAVTWQFTFVSEQAEHLTGYAPEEWYQPNFWIDHLHPDDRERAVRYCQICTERGESHDFRFRFLAKDGRTLWVREIVTVITEHGKPVQLRGVMIDITDEVETRAALDRSESMLRMMLESSPDILFRLDREGTCLDAHAARADVLWIPREQLINRPITESMPAGYANQSMRAIIRALDTQSVQSFEYSGEESGERDRYWEARVFPVNDNEVIAHCREITEQRRSEKMLVEKDRFLHTLIRHLPGYVYRCRNDRDWTMEYLSEGIEQMLGYPSSTFVESRTLSIGQLIHPDDCDRVWKEVQKALADRRSFDLSYRIRASSGAFRWFYEQGTGVFDEAGELIAIEGFVSDITDRVAADDSLRRRLAAESLVASVSTDFINRPVDEIDDAVHEALREFGVFTGSDRSYVFLVDEGGDTFSNTHEWCAPEIKSQQHELQRMSIDEYDWSWKRLRRLETIHLHTLDQVPENSVERESFRSGGIRSIAFVPLTMRGEVVGLIGIDSVRRERIWPSEDITLLRTIGEIIIAAIDRRRAETALRMSESRYKMLAENTSDFVSLHDIDGNYLYASPSVEKATGYRPEELLGRNGYDVMHPVDRERVQNEAHHFSIEHGNADTVWRFVCKDGSTIWCETRVTAIHDENGQPHRLVCSSRNITERKRVEEALQQSEQLFARVFRASPVPIAIARIADGAFIDVNDAYLDMYELKRDQVIGRSSLELGLWENPEDRDRLRKMLEHTQSIRNLEAKARTYTGKLRDTLVFVERIQFDGEPCIVALIHDVTENKRSEAELKRANSRQRLLLSELDHRVRNNLASLAALIDITSRNADDVQELADSVRGRVQAMSAVHGLLSRGRWHCVKIPDLIETLVPADLMQQITHDGGDTALASNQSTAMGMIIQELVANSLKYGALSVPGGTVNIQWTETPMNNANGDRTLELHWREANGPVIMNEPEEGIGMPLINGLVRSELRGTVEVRYPETGASHRFMLTLDPIRPDKQARAQ